LHFQIHRFNGFATLRAAADVGLVGDDNQQEVRRLKSGASLGNIVVKFEIPSAGWRVRLSIADHNAVEYSVAIQKNCAPRYFMVSHFVSVSLRVG
jgi:hypothetical protein